MPAVLTLDPETRTPVIECEPTGGDKATRKSMRSEFSKIVGALGFIHGKDGRWELDTIRHVHRFSSAHVDEVDVGMMSVREDMCRVMAAPPLSFGGNRR